MVSQQTADRLWFEWMFIFGSSVIVYSIIYRIAFQKQLSRGNGNSQIIVTSSSNDQNVVRSKISTIDENKNLDITEKESTEQKTVTIESSKQTQKELPKIYTPLNCMKFASCSISVLNCTLCVFASISLFYHQYWQDPIYGTPGIPFYISATCQAYFFSDLMGDIIIYYWFQLPSFRRDVLIHHCFAMSVIPWMMIPTPRYAWFMITIAFSFEFSTIFLNGTFFCKWYDQSEALTMKFKLGFLLSWFLVRVPGSIGLIIWMGLYGDRLLNEYPTDKFIGVIILCSFNFIMQSMWTVLIIRKTYRTLTATDSQNDAVDGFDLKRRNSIEISNVTSEA